MRMAMLTVMACGLIVLSAPADQPAKLAKDGVVREIVGRFDTLSRDQIAKQVDFTKEYLLYFRWGGVADDELSFALEEGPLVVFSFTPGTAKNKEKHKRVYALPKNAKWRMVETKKSTRTPAVTKISSAKELARTLPDLK